MRRNGVFLLTGKPGTGKTTAVKRTLALVGADKCGGFYTEEIRDVAGRVGFRCVTVARESREIAHVDSPSPLRVGRYGVMVESFEKIAVPSVRASLAHAQLTVIDEIGPMQMLSGAFRQMIQELVSDPPHAVLGTVCLDSHPDIDKIKRIPGVVIYEVREDNRDAIPGMVSAEIMKLMR